MRPLGRFRNGVLDDKKWILKKQDVMAETRLCGSG
jgi:hypothetical protein